MESLVDDKTFLESIYYGADQAIFVIDVTKEGDFIFAGLNPAHERVSGFKSDYIRGKTPDDLVPDYLPAEAARAVRGNYSRCLKAGKTIEYEEMIPMKGREIHWLTRLTPLRDETGSIYRIIGSATDITKQKEQLYEEKKKFLKQLGEKEQMYWSFVQNFQGIAFRRHLDWTPVFFHGAVKQITGYTEEEFISGDPRWDQVILPEDLEDLRSNYPPEKFTDPDFSCNREYRIKRKDGEVRWVHDYLQVIPDGRNNAGYIQGALYDITEWKEITKIVEESEERFRRLAVNAKDMIYRMKIPEGIYEFVSPAAEQIFGYSVREWYDNPKLVQDIIHEDYHEYFQTAWSDLMQGKVPDTYEYKAKHRDGTLMWINQRNSPVYNDEGEIEALEGIVTDLTEFKKVEEEARQNALNLQERNKEMNCLYEVLRLVVENPGNMEKILKKTVNIIPDSWQYPDITEARITYQDKEYKTGKFKKTKWILSEDIPVDGKTNGRIEVVYLEDRPRKYKGPFLKEEEQLLSAVASELGKSIEKHQAEQNLKESEQRFRAIFSRADIGISELTPKLKFREVNDKLCTILGYSKDELLQIHCPEITHPDDIEENKEAFRLIYEGKSDHFTLEKRYRKKDGSIIWTNFTVSVIRNIHGKPDYFIGIVDDINDQKKAQQLITQSESKFRSLFECALDMIHIVDHEGTITDVNPTELETLGYSLDEMKGRRFTDFIHHEALVKTEKAFQKLQRGKNVDQYETILVSKSGKKIYVQVSAVPEMENGVMKSSRAIIRNVTDLRRASMELAEANKQLIEKNRELEQIVYVTSHDLRSPLVNIQGFNQELEMSIKEISKIISQLNLPEDLTDEIELITEQEIPEAIDFIKAGIHKMDDLLKGLLTISRLGRRPMEMDDIDMKKLVGEVIKTFEYNIKDHALKVTIGKLPGCRGDKNQLNQVFSNLVENAIKYMNKDIPGEIRISGKKADGNIIYRVKDNGIGIPESKHDRIFEIFYQNQQGKPGEGLGLTIVRKIIEKHHGRIHVESEPGKGSTFVITLPDK